MIVSEWTHCNVQRGEGGGVIARRISFVTYLRRPRMGAREGGRCGVELKDKTRGWTRKHEWAISITALCFLFPDTPSHPTPCHPFPSSPLPPHPIPKHRNPFHPVLQHIARFCHAGMSNHSGRRRKGRLVFSLMPEHSLCFRANLHAEHTTTSVGMGCATWYGGRSRYHGTNCFFCF